MLIDLDIGNSRAKWRLMRDDEIIGCGVLPTHGADWSSFFELSSYQPKRVRVSNVAGAEVASQVLSTVEKEFGIEAEFALSSECVGEVKSGYDQPVLLGVDRWLAVLAGWDLFRDRCIVIDAGSALTLDVIGSGGQHLGGYIVPGQKMLCDALFGGTSGVRASSLAASSLALGSNTDLAVRNGCYAMSVAFIEKVIASDYCGEAPMNIVLTGGDAESLLSDLPDSVLHKPDLVLDGLAIALP